MVHKSPWMFCCMWCCSYEILRLWCIPKQISNIKRWTFMNYVQTCRESYLGFLQLLDSKQEVRKHSDRFTKWIVKIYRQKLSPSASTGGMSSAVGDELTLFLLPVSFSYICWWNPVNKNPVSIVISGGDKPFSLQRCRCGVTQPCSD